MELAYTGQHRPPEPPDKLAKLRAVVEEELAQSNEYWANFNAETKKTIVDAVVQTMMIELKKTIRNIMLDTHIHTRGSKRRP